jgi:hypothetical protein
MKFLPLLHAPLPIKPDCEAILQTLEKYLEIVSKPNLALT